MTSFEPDSHLPDEIDQVTTTSFISAKGGAHVAHESPSDRITRKNLQKAVNNIGENQHDTLLWRVV